MLTQESLGASDQLARGIAETRTRLVEEFEERIEPGTIRQIVDEAFEALEDAAIRDFLPLFVYRAAHEQLTDMARASAAREPFLSGRAGDQAMRQITCPGTSARASR